MESTFKEMNGESVLDLEDKAGVGGGVEDVYGEDRASEDHAITPWTVSVASGYNLLRDPRHNKGLAFTDKERDAHYLTGLLPPALFSQDLQERNEKLFYKLLIDNVEELLPVVYTPTVGEACQKYGSIFRRPQGLFISLKEKGKILEVLKNWPEKSIQVIVVTDGERILGLGDLGCQCLPITIDVGTNNKKLLEDEFYIGLRQNRATGKFEDFANHNAFELLARYRTTHLVFNDDIQGTASVVLAGLVAALKLVGGTLADHTFLFLGAGEAGTGIAELIALEISKKDKCFHWKRPEENLAVDSKGRAIFASGSPFDPVEFNGKVFVPGQANNAYIFPGFGLGLIMSGTIRVHDDLLLAASEALAAQVTEENYAKGLIYPPFANIRKISAHIAAKVAAKAYELGLASHLPRPKDLVKYAESCMYTPVYGSYR
ncbi:UNVERIFIED_CONTAM: NADP-dependent malic enzyme [Sesamum angustifolium]|uniref:Malic enzyme n=1 Tax=Sesamum angustifolium TaxID=2727405 RepID=A0AAW2M7R6_9LAMI